MDSTAIGPSVKGRCALFKPNVGRVRDALVDKT
jgi:hypothetical protein